MSVRPYTGRMHVFRLRDLPPRVLSRALQVALREEADWAQRLAMIALADDPERSHRVYSVPETAWKRVVRQ